MKLQKTALALLIATGVSACGGDSDSNVVVEPTPPNTVETANGRITGEKIGDEIAFKGIPFAKPPVGNLRWAAPQPVVNWSGTRDAKEYGSKCMQPAFAVAPGYSEDCLYLNVFKPATAKVGDKLPVHVWIHGGGFTNGSASEALYQNSEDTAAGIIYVNINYRLNVFGFMSHPGLTKEAGNLGSGNYGLMDQIAALTWVKNNIAQFGGDPSMVTVSGESAGAASIGFLLASEKAKGLFKRVLMESTFGFHPMRTRKQAEEYATGRFGTDLSALRSLSAAELMTKAGAGDGVATNGGLFAYEDWVPAVDGVVLKKSDRQAWKDGDFMTVDMLIGDNENEGYAFSRGNTKLPKDQRNAKNFNAFISNEFGIYGNEAYGLYAVSSDEEVELQLGLAYGDGWFQASSREMSRKMMQRTPRVYRYLFTKHAANPMRVNGVPVTTHAGELPYMFGKVQDGGSVNFFGHNFKFDASDVKISKALIAAKQNFIKTGSPAGTGDLKNWPIYDHSDPYMEFGDKGLQVGRGHRNAQFDLRVEYMNHYFPLN